MLSDGNITVYDIEGNKIKGMKLMQAMKIEFIHPHI